MKRVQEVLVTIGNLKLQRSYATLVLTPADFYVSG